jgi:hypothetical protein
MGIQRGITSKTAHKTPLVLSSVWLSAKKDSEPSIDDPEAIQNL